MMPTHIFVLEDGTKVPVQVEMRGDPVAVDVDGHRWSTVMGVFNPEWVCADRGITRVREVRMPNGELHPEIAVMVDLAGAHAEYGLYRTKRGEPLRKGWVLHFTKARTAIQKKVLRKHGYEFIGGEWSRPDPID